MKLFKQHNLKEAGFSLAEIVVSMGVMGLSSLFVMNMMQDQSNNDSIAKYRFEVNSAVSIVQNAANNSNRCNEMFQGKVVSAGGTEIASGLKINAGQTTLLAVGTYPGYLVTSIKLMQSVLFTSSFDLVITFAPKPQMAYIPYFASQTSTTKKVTIVGTIDATQKVTTCSSVVSDSNIPAKKAFCDSLNTTAGTAVWDGATNKCRLNLAGSACTGNQIPTQYRKLGGWYCEDISGQIGMGYLFDLSAKSCPAHMYALYLNGVGRITVGCPTPAQRSFVAPPLAN